MKLFRKPTAAVVDSGPTPTIDETNGVPFYTQDVTALTTNPPDLILAPASLVSHPSYDGRPVYGIDNFQQFQSGHTNIIDVNPTEEQGFGRAPGWQWARMPHVQQFNWTIPHETYMQDGGGFHGFSERIQRSPIWPEGYLHYTQQPDQHQMWPHIATVNQPEIPSFTEFVPPIG